VYEHRFLDTELLWYLLRQAPEEAEAVVGADGESRPRKYGFGLKALYKRLQQLAEARYLQPHQAMPRPVGRGFGGTRTAYGLGSQSTSTVSDMTGMPVQLVRDIVEANKVKAPFIQHALDVARLRVILELACRASEGRVRLMFWEQGIILQDWITGENDDGEEVRYSVYPDAFFALEVEGKGRAHYFLELDRGTMPIVAKGNRSDIKKKIIGYWLYRKARRHSQRYRYRTLPDGTVVGIDMVERERSIDDDVESPDVKSFRVLIVAPGVTEENGTIGGRIANIISEFPSFGKQYETSTLFWFAPPDSFDPEKPETIFDHVWLTPNPGHELKSLIE
jgi:hypothetical protein